MSGIIHLSTGVVILAARPLPKCCKQLRVAQNQPANSIGLVAPPVPEMLPVVADQAKTLTWLAEEISTLRAQLTTVKGERASPWTCSQEMGSSSLWMIKEGHLPPCGRKTRKSWDLAASEWAQVRR
jgi:hypothetical protein